VKVIKVIFLDVDGVLNTDATWEMRYIEFVNNRRIICPVDEFRIQYLKKIIDEVDAKIVLFSTWSGGFKKEDNKVVPLGLRNNSYAEGFYNILKKYKIEIYDKISKNETLMKNSEKINLWLLNHTEVSEFIIIEDEVNSLLESFSDKIIDVSKDGLSFEHVSIAIKKLNSNKCLRK